MHKRFDHKDFEKKWQEKWASAGIYRTEDSDKPKTFVLDMFPYPSGEGLHVGHPKGYIATDIYSRFKRMTGHEVLHPMGWDAFGLPAENFAIKHKVHPRVAVDKNIANFKSQLSKLGFDYDWNREINTTDPEFYKWTQWIFVQLFKKGLAYESHEPINWCPGCQTGLANEDLEADGTCERCDSVVEKRPMRQWVLKIREYADRMLEDLDTLEWPEHIKEAQRNWIGKSQGAEIDFKLSTGDSVTVFTTRPDTLFGATYMVFAPEHELVVKNKGNITNWSDVESYIKEAANKKEMDRLDNTKEKTGVILEGIVAINPANNEEIPVYIADYVLAGYGTGAIMAVPAHDERDHAFAAKYDIPIKEVVVPERIDKRNPPVDGKEKIERQNVHAYVTDPKTGKVLCLEWKEHDWRTLPMGGVEEGETLIEAARREVREETGYTELSQGKVAGGQVRAEYFAAHKDVNRVSFTNLVCFELVGDTQEALSPEEAANYDVKWLDPKDVTLESMTHAEMDIWLERVALLDQAEHLFTGAGVLVDSGDFTGMDSEEAKQAITEKVGGRMTSTYKIKDWVFSRQRYWGEPFPMVHLEDGTAVPIAEEQLPVKLPEVEYYEPAGDGRSPLANIEDWVNVTGYLDDAGDFVVADEAPNGQKLIKATRETNTMPQWAGSSWYYLRYIDPKNNDALIDPKKEKQWQPVDVYVGGDHAVRHLIYARFWHKFLYDMGVVSTIEPFQRLEFLGFILAEDGRKMSKRWGNVINPDDIVDLVGADTMRVYEMFMGPFENTIAWSKDGLAGARRFLEKVNGLSEHITDNEPKEVTAQLHKTIKKVSEDIENFKFNTAVSAMMIFVNLAEKEGLTQASYKAFLKLLAPFAPHLTEELWAEMAGNSGSIHTAEFPAFDPALAVDETVTIGVQINGKVRGDITIAPDATEEEVMAVVRASEQLAARLSENIIKIIYKPGKILNILQS
ncbi:MAG: leucine--tRNA ligase [Bacteroidetes bacterium]|nr:MAG: leucine--tRNA ligase [Bacteroidota bacterium]